MGSMPAKSLAGSAGVAAAVEAAGMLAGGWVKMSAKLDGCGAPKVAADGFVTAPAASPVSWGLCAAQACLLAAARGPGSLIASTELRRA